MTQDIVDLREPSHRFEGRESRQEFNATGRSRRSGWTLLLALTWAGALVPWVIGDGTVLGFTVTGWAWIVGGAAAALTLAVRPGKITFPLGWCAPWALVLTLAWIEGIDRPAAGQSYVQILCPLVVGCAASSFDVRSGELSNVRAWITWLPLAFWVLAAYRLPSLLDGKLLSYGWLGSELCGVALWAAVFAGFVAAGERRYLLHFASVVALPLAFLVRGPAAAAGLSYPLTPGPLGLSRRLIAVGMFLVIGVLVLATPRFQARMFQSGRGTVEDIRLDNPDLATSGRSLMWSVLSRRIDECPWVGHGLNASREVLESAGFSEVHPHNDWIKIAHDAGYVGAACFALAMLGTMGALVRIGRCSRGDDRALAFGAAGGFVPFLLLMVTDNVLLYAQFYGNVHFALVGAVFARARRGTLKRGGRA